jgi:hypothetical protein
MMTVQEVAQAREAMAQPGYAGPFHEHDGYLPHTHEVRPDHQGVDWTWPAGKSFGELSPAGKREAARRASEQIARELAANAEAISRVMDSVTCHVCGGEADGACVICDRPVCDNHAGSRAYDRWCRDHEWHRGGA